MTVAELERVSRPHREANQAARRQADETIRQFREFEARMRAHGVWPTDLAADRPGRQRNGK